MFGKKFLINVLEESNAELYTNHTTFHKGDSGLDLFIMNDVFIGPYETQLVKLGISCQSRKFNWCPFSWLTGKFYKYYSYILMPRSSISKTPLMMRNSIGLIDAGYTGELMASLYNTSAEPFVLKRGERYFQLVNNDLGEVDFKLVNSLRNTTRGSGGFGSTDKPAPAQAPQPTTQAPEEPLPMPPTEAPQTENQMTETTDVVIPIKEETIDLLTITEILVENNCPYITTEIKEDEHEAPENVVELIQVETEQVPKTKKTRKNKKNKKFTPNLTPILEDKNAIPLENLKSLEDL